MLACMDPFSELAVCESPGPNYRESKNFRQGTVTLPVMCGPDSRASRLICPDKGFPTPPVLLQVGVVPDISSPPHHQPLIRRRLLVATVRDSGGCVRKSCLRRSLPTPWEKGLNNWRYDKM